MIFKHFPQIARYEEEQRLEEQDETHPLIVAGMFRRSTVPYSCEWIVVAKIFRFSSVKDCVR